MTNVYSSEGGVLLVNKSFPSIVASITLNALQDFTTIVNTGLYNNASFWYCTTVQRHNITLLDKQKY